MEYTIKDRITYLEERVSKDKKKRAEIEDKHFPNFTKYASYMGNGIYEWRGIHSADTRELFLMGILVREGISYEQI